MCGVRGLIGDAGGAWDLGLGVGAVSRLEDPPGAPDPVVRSPPMSPSDGRDALRPAALRMFVFAKRNAVNDTEDG
ncbi:hypothetical protein [Streptomyces sp. NPDC001100]